MELWRLHVCQSRYICLQQSDIEIKATYQLKQQIIIRFLSFGVLIKSNVPYLRVSSLLTSAFLTSVITCFRCWESISTPFLAAYFMSRLWASSRRLLARSHRGDSGIHLREIIKQRFIPNKGTLGRLFFQIYWQWWHLGFATYKGSAWKSASIFLNINHHVPFWPHCCIFSFMRKFSFVGFIKY